MKILVIHTAFIGDIVLSTPLLKRIKEVYPEAKDGKLSITISFLGTEETDEYTYSIKKNVLSLSDGNNTIELNKK